MAYAIGLMSGTSLDGVDAALVKLDGEFTFVDGITVSYSKTLKDRIIKALDIASSSNKLLTELNFELGQVFADTTIQLMKKNNLVSKDITFIASHGHTIWHNPKNEDNLVNSTMQLGESSVIAYLTNILVVSDFRVMDMAAHGQGAPLVPYAEYVLHNSDKESNVFLNIGGISNITYLRKNSLMSEVIAFDTGPGNMMIDYTMNKFFNLDYDNDGLYALKGKLMDNLFKELMNHRYLKIPYPKSTGREMLGKEYTNYLIKKYRIDKGNVKDFIHTLSCFTAKSIVLGINQINNHIDNLVVSGGGAKNSFILNKLKEYSNLTVITYNDFGFNSDYKEAVAFVVLGSNTLAKLTNNLPSVTGAEKSVILGKITQI